MQPRDPQICYMEQKSETPRAGGRLNPGRLFLLLASVGGSVWLLENKTLHKTYK